MPPVGLTWQSMHELFSLSENRGSVRTSTENNNVKIVIMEETDFINFPYLFEFLIEVNVKQVIKFK
jgi:hypothetical protein